MQVVVDFEDVAPTGPINPCFGGPPVTATCVLNLTSRGFLFESPVNAFTTHAHLVSAPFNASGTPPAHQYYATNGTQYIGLDPSIIVMRLAAGGRFSLERFDAAEGFRIDPVGDRRSLAGAPLIPATAAGLEVVGTKFGGGTVTFSYVFDGINDSILGSLADFETFVLPATFTDLVDVTFHGLNTGGARAFALFSIDNLAATGVPAPGTLLLASLGLAALGAARRSRAGITPRK